MYSTIESIQRLEKRIPRNVPLFDVVYSDVYDIIKGKVCIEIEISYHQMKQLMQSLGDIVVAMKVKSFEAINFVENEDVDVFSSYSEGTENIFNVDHMLDVEQLYIQYSQEYSRKKSIIQHVLTLPRPKSSVLNKIIASWSDDHEDSLIDSNFGMLY